MKLIFTLVIALLVVMPASLCSQATGDRLFVIDVIIDNQITTFYRGPCGFEAAKWWGAPVDGSFCGPVVWGYTINGDSLGCDSLSGNYSDKIVMLRRGTCEFTYKALLAEQAGARAVAIANGYWVTHGDDCTVNLMGVPENAMHQIPAVFFSRQMTNFIDEAIKAGKNPMVCFRLVNIFSPTAEYAYATPVAQADTMDLLTCRVGNYTGTAQVLTAHATITDPNGVATTLTTSKFMDMQTDSIFHFPSYTPPKVEGKFKVVYTVDGFIQPGDTIFREFELTKHTFATDNLILSGGEEAPAQLISGTHSNASLYRTGDIVFNAGWAAFAVHQSGVWGIPPAPANIVSVVVYDADPDNDGMNDLTVGMSTAFDALPFVAFADFEIQPNAHLDSIMYVPLTPVGGDSVLLKPNHYYYVGLLHDDLTEGVFLPFATSSKVEYGYFENVGPITPVGVQGYDIFGWPDRTVINRLVDAAFKPDGTSVVKTTPLVRSKFKLSPNPAGSETVLQLDLAAPNKSVEVLLIGMRGEIISRQTFKNFRDGQVRLDVSHLPSGNYGVLVRASEEGSGMVNLVVGH